MIKNLSIIFLFLCLLQSASAQTTRDPNAPTESETTEKGKKGGHKILLIPFELKMYLSEIDKKVGESNKMNFNQVRNTFRKGLDKKLGVSLASHYSTYSMLSDSAASDKDLSLIHQSISYSYTPVPGQEKKEEKKKLKTEKGHLNIESGSEKRFMSTVINNPKLLSYLDKKYHVDVFLFINELDIKNDPDSYDAVTDTYQREIAVHYTAFDNTGKQLCSNIASIRFSSLENDPKKIINAYFSVLARTIQVQLVNALTVPNPINLKK